ncbi:MAG: endolytic transglycosylase MltG [Candidatus Electrothrix sp. AR3]|nr:endolytic transglycosylase MltG [Candidatus Electrothrix sp. AR3]
MRFFLSLLCTLLILTGVIATGWFTHYLVTPSVDGDEVLVVIPRGACSRKIKDLLAAKGLIQDDIRFLVLIRLLRIFDTANPPNLRAGEFQVPFGLTPLEVVRFLHKAKPISYRVTIPEGKTMTDIAKIFAQKGWADPQLFLKLCRDREFIQALGVEADSLEGYLFPETYTLVRNASDEQAIITSMVERFFTVWNPMLEQGQGQEGLDARQLLVLASMIEKETGRAGERDIIAGVFYNRLKKGMRLQSDPTTIYGIKNFNGNLTRADLRKATPYNTYVIPALPPGPICNPGAKALHAALHPAEVTYYYFVSKNNGSHYFSKTLKEHNRAVYRYQKRKRKK